MEARIKPTLASVGIIWLLASISIGYIEVLNRGLEGTIAFIGGDLITFLANVNGMALIIAPAFLFKRKLFVSFILQMPWLIAALTNRLLMVMRGTPFIWRDLQSIGEGASLASQYITTSEMIQIGGFVTMSVVTLILSFKNHQEDKREGQDRVLDMVVVSMMLIAVQSVCMPVGVKAYDVTLVEEDYKNNGFFCGFINNARETLQNQKEQVYLADEVVEALAEQTKEKIGRSPNIIMVQLESAFDPYKLEGVSYSKDPIANIREAMASGYSGPLRVRTFCGGTARTEFEVLTGMSMVYTSGGIPYTDGTVQDKAIESIGYILKERGYTTTAIHNHEGSFFDRNTVYSKLGFDNFVFKENMEDVAYADGWAKDELVVDYIKRVLKETKEEDFVFGLTVNTHGAYPFEYEGLNYDIQIDGVEDEKAKKQLEKYIDRLTHLDKVMGELIQFVEAAEEDIILVLYSDHCPNLEVLKGIDVEIQFTTFYTIIDNQGLLPKAQDQYLQSYQLYPKLFELLGIQEGIMNKMHQTYWEEEDYETYFKGTQQLVLEGLDHVQPTTMKIGLEQSQEEGMAYVELY